MENIMEIIRELIGKRIGQLMIGRGKIFSNIIRIFMFFIFILFGSCKKPFETLHGRIIPEKDIYFKVETIKNTEYNIDDIKGVNYSIARILSDDNEYISEIYTKNRIIATKMFTDDYYKLLIDDEWNSILYVTRISDNKKIINGFNIFPNDKIIIYKNKLYCHQGNLIYELDLINLTKNVKYVYDKSIDVYLVNIINNELILDIKEIRWDRGTALGYKPIKRRFKIKI
jgi:hypothetical protein